MTKPFDVADSTLAQIAQGLLEGKKMARSLENTATSFIPLTDNQGVMSALERVEKNAQLIATELSDLYKLVARDAAKAGFSG